MASRDKKHIKRKSGSAELLDALGIREQTAAMLIRIDGDATRLPTNADQDPVKAAIRTHCEEEMARITDPVLDTLEGIPALLQRNFVAVDDPAKIVAKVRKEVRKLQRESRQQTDKLGALRDTKHNEMNALMATYRPSRPFVFTSKRKLMRNTILIGFAEAAANGLVLFTVGFKGGLLGAAAAAALPAIVNIGGGVLLGTVLLRLIRRENANLFTRCVAWNGINLLVSITAVVNVGFAYLRVTGNLEGLLQYLLSGKIDYSVPAVCAIGIALSAITTYKWWFASHPNIQIEKLGREIIDLDRKIEQLAAALDADAEAVVDTAQATLDELELAEGDDLNAANDSYAKLVVLVGRLLIGIEHAQSRHADVMRDYNRMIFDALGHSVPQHYKEGAAIAVGEPRIPDIEALKALLGVLERDYRQLRAHVAQARILLGKEPDRTLGRADFDDSDLAALTSTGSIGASVLPATAAAPSEDAAPNDRDAAPHPARRQARPADVLQIEHRQFKGPQAAE